MQVIPVEFARLRDHADLKDRDPFFTLERPPGIDIGVVVELGDDDRVAGLQPAPDGPCQVKGQRRHVEAKANLGGRGVQEVRQRASCRGQGGVSLGAGRKPPVRVGIVMKQVVGHGLDHDGRDLGSARPVEIGGRMALVNPLERGEGRANLVDRRNREPEWLVSGTGS